MDENENAPRSDSRRSGNSPRRETAPKRSLGQNFLVDGRYAEAIVRRAELSEGDWVIEIGPGRGALTRRLLERGVQLLAVEKDAQLAAELAASLGGPPRLMVHEGDVLNMDVTSLLPADVIPIVVSNLPYNVSVPILFQLLRHRDRIARMILMFQKEVADRLAAEPDSREYGIPTVLAWLSCQIDTLFDVPPSAFRPRPKVISTVIRVTPFAEPRIPITDRLFFERMLNLLFQKRRKTLSRSLKMSGYALPSGVDPPIDLKRRVDTLDPRELVALSDWLRSATR
ncbi:MAG: ribosomal RNA small subunit methyltransferase A [Myxococcales bacterium]|nr:ribosomal RNA small subunit methyltransferase A [Myxococcales bacterium]